MRLLKQFAIILVITFVAELLNYLIPLPVPSSIYGIIILFVCLSTNIIPLEEIKDVGKFLIEIMPLMFIPAAVELLDVLDIIGHSFVSYTTITIVSTIVVLVVSGRITQFFVKRKRAKGGNI